MTGPNLTGESALPDEPAALERDLRRALHRFDCPPAHTLGEYELDLLDPEQRTSIAQHVLDCPRCADELRSLRTFLREEPLEPIAAGPLERLRRIVATLTPAPQWSHAGVRGDADPHVRTYRAAGLTVTLGPGIAARPSRAALIGMLIPEGDAVPSEESGTARLYRADAAEPSAAAEIDDLGNFAFEELERGAYYLELHIGDLIVVLPEFEVGDQG